jgi:hypothetical protein
MVAVSSLSSTLVERQKLLTNEDSGQRQTMFNIWDGYTDDNLADTPSATSDRGNRLPLDITSKIGASLWESTTVELQHQVGEQCERCG